jgi:hypothetical protein
MPQKMPQILGLNSQGNQHCRVGEFPYVINPSGLPKTGGLAVKPRPGGCRSAVLALAGYGNDCYIPHEIYMLWDRADGYMQQLYPGLVERCKRAADLFLSA